MVEDPRLQRYQGLSLPSSLRTGFTDFERYPQVSEETVLADATGLHLSAGPYFLLYSKTVPEEEENARVEWPDNFKNSVKHNNRAFLRDLPDELAAQVFDPNSPPTSPSAMPATPSEFTIASDVVEPPESRGEPMDTTD